MKRERFYSTLRKCFVFLLCFSLIFSNIAYVPVHAEEGEDTAYEEEWVEDTEEETEPEAVDEEVGSDADYEETEPETSDEDTAEADTEDQEPAEEEVRQITLTKDQISFGTLEQGVTGEPVVFQVINEGNQDVSLKWTKTDINGAFYLDVPSSEIAPGEEIDCCVGMTEGLEPGDYSATILFEDEEDGTSNATLGISVKIKEKPEPEPDDRPTPKPEQDTKEKPKPTPGSREKKGSKKSSETNKETQKKTKRSKKAARYKIRVTLKPGSAGKVTGMGTFKRGQNTILTAYAKRGYSFDGWYDTDGDLIDDEKYIVLNNIQENFHYIARYKHVYYKINLTSSSKKLGKVSGGGKYQYGQDAVIKAVPKKGCVFAGWFEDGELLSREKELVLEDVEENRNIKGVFRPGLHQIYTSCYPADAGEITGEGAYADGEDVLLTATAREGYIFRGFLLNNQIISTKKAYKIRKLDRDLSITAYFEKENESRYEMVSGVANKGGAISPSGSLWIGEHGSITYTMAPDNGFAIQEVYVDGKPVGAKNSYTFKDISEDHEISVVFAPKKDNEKHVKKDKVITKEEAKQYSTMKLYPATEDDEERSSELITPEMYQKMKSEGDLSDIIMIDKQNIVGVDDSDLPEKVDAYNYDEAEGLFQMMDLTPDATLDLIRERKDKDLVKTAYDYNLLNILINNQYLIPDKEEEVNDVFEDDKTIDDMFEFIDAVLTKEEKMDLFGGQEYTVSIGITPVDDLQEEEKAEMEKAGAVIDEFFYITVNKQRGEEDPILVEELENPIRITMDKPKGEEVNCVVHYHKGKIEILDDIDDSPDTITIKTATFSPYAFAKKTGSKGFPVLPLAGGAAVLVLLAIALLLKKEGGRG